MKTTMTTLIGYLFFIVFEIITCNSIYSQTALKLNNSQEAYEKGIATSIKSANSINTNLIYLSPVAGSSLNSPSANIILRFNSVLDKQFLLTPDILTVTGSESNVHSGKINLAGDGKTVLFQPAVPFNNGESVKVQLNSGLKTLSGNSIGEINFNFSISANMNKVKFNPEALIGQMSYKTAKTNQPAIQSSSRPQSVTKNSLLIASNYPQYTIQSSNPTSGYLFLSNVNYNTNIQNQPFLMIR